MCRQFNKQSVKKKIFSVTTLAAFGLLFWLRSPDILGEKQRLPASPAITQAACTQPQHHPSEKTNSPPENRPVPSHPSDFTYAARLATPAVVHIQSIKNPRSVKRAFASPLDQLLKELFGDRLLMPREYQQPAQEAFGSGVIYKSNGYIITNNHVVEGADQIKVTLNDNRSYEAKLVGADPTTDLALLKIEACNLPVLVLGNSDQLEVGEWVLAVGNPLNLCSTVTKGIVSAKSRALENSGSGELRIQSFIQTDAVINKGNSGGALVNLSGELVGINTAIYASATAAFIGYGFAIPSSLVKKVADDFIQYGAVQRVLLGVTIQDVNAKSAKELGLKAVYGVRIDHVSPKSPCVRLLQKDDVITQINGRPISKATELQEIIGCAKPGDKIAITFYRRGKQQTVDVVLEHRKESVQLEGATFQNLDSKSKAKLKISNGVLVKEIAKGKFQAAGLQKGYILLAFDKQPVTSTDELAEMVKRATEPVMIQIMDPNKGTISYLAVELGTPIHHTQHRE